MEMLQLPGSTSGALLWSLRAALCFAPTFRAWSGGTKSERVAWPGQARSTHAGAWADLAKAFLTVGSLQ